MNIPANAGNIHPEDLGTLAPNAVPAYNRRQVHLEPPAQARAPRFGNDGAGYYTSPHEPARWYFDYALTLMRQQDGQGRFISPRAFGTPIQPRHTPFLYLSAPSVAVRRYR